MLVCLKGQQRIRVSMITAEVNAPWSVRSTQIPKLIWLMLTSQQNRWPVLLWISSLRLRPTCSKCSFTTHRVTILTLTPLTWRRKMSSAALIWTQDIQDALWGLGNLMGRCLQVRRSTHSMMTVRILLTKKAHSTPIKWMQALPNNIQSMMTWVRVNTTHASNRRLKQSRRTSGVVAIRTTATVTQRLKGRPQTIPI
jgi:hypothetical protein